jgi:hypothetical protein
MLPIPSPWGIWGTSLREIPGFRVFSGHGQVNGVRPVVGAGLADMRFCG